MKGRDSTLWKAIEAGRLPDLEGEVRRDHAIGASANAVGAEILACHVVSVQPGEEPARLRFIAGIGFRLLTICDGS